MARVNVLGVGISAVCMDTALELIGEWVRKRQRKYICVCTVHTVMEARQSPALREVINSSGLSTPDGMPLVWLARAAGYRSVNRVYGPDLMLAEMDRSRTTGHRHFLYGGKVGVVDKLQHQLVQRYPGIAIVGCMSPPMATLDELCTPDTAKFINAAAPDIVWIGISTPKQDMWMSRMRPLLRAPVLIGVGAAFDFHAGLVSQAPRWMQRSGLEWFFRLIQEPGRLWRRYLIHNTRFIYEITRQKLGITKYELLP